MLYNKLVAIVTLRVSETPLGPLPVVLKRLLGASFKILEGVSRLHFLGEGLTEPLCESWISSDGPSNEGAELEGTRNRGRLDPDDEPLNF